MDEKKIVNAVYDMLLGQAFEDFHKGELEDHILGEPDAKSKEEIKERIKQLLHL